MRHGVLQSISIQAFEIAQASPKPIRKPSLNQPRSYPQPETNSSPAHTHHSTWGRGHWGGGGPGLAGLDYIHVYIYICIYIYIHTHTHTHTHIYIYIYVCIYIFTHTDAIFTPPPPLGKFAQGGGQMVPGAQLASAAQR